MPRARCAAAPSGSLWQGVHFYATCWRCLAACRVGLLSLRKNRNANSRPADLRVVNRRGLWTRVQARQPRSARLWHLRGEHPGGMRAQHLNAGPDDVSSRRWSATNGSRGSSRVEFVHSHASGTRSAAPRGICRVTARVLQPPANQCRLLATIDTRRTARTSQPRGDRWAGEAFGTDIQLGPDGRREGAISRGSNFGLCEGVKRGKALLFFFTM